MFSPSVILKKALAVLLITGSVLTARSQNITKPNIQGPQGLQVNSYTGNLFYQRQDLYIPNTGLPIDISFSYNSADRKRNLGYGYGWMFNYNQYYKRDTSGGIIIYNGDGRSDRYAHNNSGFIAPTGLFTTLVEYAAGKFVLTTKNKTRYFFDDSSHKKLTRIVDRNTNTLVFSYSGGNLVSILDEAGRTVNFTWTGQGLTEIKAQAGNLSRTVKYEYNADGYMVKVTNPLNDFMNYTYGVTRAMTGMTDYNGNAVSISYTSKGAVNKIVSCNLEKTITYLTDERKTYETDKSGDKTIATIYEFDALGRMINKKGNCCGFNISYTYDANNNISTMTDANGNKTSYSYDAKGNLVMQVDALNNTSLFVYDTAFNQVLSATDKKGNKTLFSYDNKGNLLQKTEPLNRITKFAYDQKGRIITVTNPKNAATLYQYDAFGNTVSVKNALNQATSFSNDGFGNIVTVTDAKNNVVNFLLDGNGRVTKITNSLGGTVQYTYDPNGNVLSQKDPNNHQTTYLYDSRNKPILITDALQNNIAFVYDGFGNLEKMINQKGYKTSWTYDQNNRPATETNAINEVTSYSYDNNGNRTIITTSNGRVISYLYDKLNRVTKMSDNLGPISSYTYDQNSNLQSMTDWQGSSVTYVYDALNRLVQQNDQVGNTVKFEYDLNGNVVKKTDRNNNATTFSYNAVDQQTSFTDALSFTTNLTYDPIGNILSVVDPKGHSTSYTYDALSRIVQENFADNSKKVYVYDAAGNISSFTNQNSQVITYSYDPLNRMIAKAHSGGIDSLKYDAMGFLVRAKNPAALVQFNYDAINRKLSESLNGRSTSYAYNSSLNTVSITFPNGRRIEKSYNSRNLLNKVTENNSTIVEFLYNLGGLLLSKNFKNLTSISYAYTNNTLVKSIDNNPSQFLALQYNYDNEGNPLSIQRVDNPLKSETYVYDKLYQLKSRNLQSGQQTSINYDAVGNRTSAQIGATTYNYNSTIMNSYSAINSGANNQSLGYDLNGNLTSDGARTYSYDHENKLTGIAGTQAAAYSYDALGRRVKKVVNGTLTEFFYDGFQIIQETSNQQDKTYIWGNWIDDILSMRSNSQDYYYHTNSIGTVVGVTSADGLLAESYQYDAFGKQTIFNSGGAIIPISLIGNPYGYTGRELDAESGQLYYRSRHYSPELGRFLQRDPMDYVSVVNKYTYVNNNPATLIDPQGTTPLLVTAAIGAAIGGVVGGVVALSTGQDWKSAALKGAISGGISGLTLGLAGPALAGYFGGGVIGSMLAGSTISAANNLLTQGYDYLTEDCYEFKWGEFAFQAAAGTLYRAPLSGNVQVTSWSKYANPDLKSGRWVVEGANTEANYFKTGLAGAKADTWLDLLKGNIQKGIPYESAHHITETLPSSSLQTPYQAGKGVIEGIKGYFFGQYIIK